jgi:predicted metal-dependent peptidase
MSEEEKTTEFDLNMHTARLLMAEPFFAALSRRIDKKKTRSIPTAGVRVNPTTAQFELFYNPDFMESLTDVQKLGVLKHEFYHIIFEHVTSRRPEGKMTREDNIQMDLAINSNLIGELPDDCCMPGVGPYEWAPVGKSYEWYKANWQEPEQDENGEGEGTEKARLVKAKDRAHSTTTLNGAVRAPRKVLLLTKSPKSVSRKH